MGFWKLGHVNPPTKASLVKWLVAAAILVGSLVVVYRYPNLVSLNIIFEKRYMQAALLVSLLSVWVLVGLFYYLNRYTKRYYFAVWTAAWLFYALWLTLGISLPNAAPNSLGSIIRQCCVSISAVFLLWGSLSFLEMPVRQSLLGLFMLFLITWGYVGRFLAFDAFQVQFPVFVLIGVASMFSGFSFYRLRKHRPFVAVGMLFLGFFLWGIYLISYPFSIKYPTLTSVGLFFSAVLQLFIAVSMIVLVLEEARHINEKIKKEIEDTNREKRELQLKVLSTEEQCRSLFSQAHVREELQSAYDQLRQTHQSVVQQERLRALGHMASGIAHDINNALSPILAFAEMVLKNESDLSEKSRRQLEHIRTSAEDIAHTVARLSEFHRRREHADRLSFASPNRLLEQVAELTSPCWRDIPQSRGISIQVRTRLDEHLPDLWCHESELREALTNIILNAVDALPDGGTITLSSRALCPAQNAGQPSHVVFEVIDDGIGMDEATRQRCLEPFFSTKTHRGGSGLGLAMVYGTMERHGGRIEVESQIKQGTTIRLVFPLRQPAAAQPKPAPAAVPDTGKMHILCIDDEPLLREVLKEAIEMRHHAVDTADGGGTGLEAFHRARNEGRPYDVVITDLGMPGVNGRQVAEAIKKSSPGTSVVMLTGWGGMIEESSDNLLHVDALLSKPPRVNEVLDTLARLRARPDATRLQTQSRVASPASLGGTSSPLAPVTG